MFHGTVDYRGVSEVGHVKIDSFHNFIIAEDEQRVVFTSRNGYAFVVKKGDVHWKDVTKE